MKKFNTGKQVVIIIFIKLIYYITIGSYQNSSIINGGTQTQTHNIKIKFIRSNIYK